MTEVWSQRSSFPREPSRLARLIAAHGRDSLIDLSESNPTRCGFADRERLALLADPAGAHYAPESFGLASTRLAVAKYYRRRGVAVDPEHVVLSASTSEAYAWVFKLLCDPGDVVLSPRPSYPLLEHLALFESVRLVDYPLRRDDGWQPDLASLAEAMAAHAPRALMLVHPHNPSGALLHDREALLALCRAHDVALIVDEVFLDYLRQDSDFPSFAATRGVRCYTLSGLSKVALAPQLKLSWLVVGEQLRAEALARLEVIADTFLSVSTPTQLAAASLLERVEPLQATLRARLAENLAALDAAIAAVGDQCPVRRLAADGGWYALVEIPRTRSDDDWLALLIEREAIVVHPGYFFDMAQDGTMVVSLLLEPERFADAIARAVRLWSEA